MPRRRGAEVFLLWSTWSSTFFNIYSCYWIVNFPNLDIAYRKLASTFRCHLEGGVCDVAGGVVLFLVLHLPKHFIILIVHYAR